MIPQHRLPHHDFAHLADVHQRPGGLARWERLRHRKAHWFVECFAEALGVFFYVFAGVGSTAIFVIGNIAGETGLSSVLQIGMAYAIGIVLALVVCSATSGGHFNPGITIAFTVFKGFPKIKAIRYIVAQILGAYIACLLVYVQYRDLIVQTEEALRAKGLFDSVNFTAQGPAGIFALYVAPGASLGQIFLNEFMCDVFIGLTIWSTLDPTNFLATPVAAPWLVAFSYAACIWGYSPVGLAANSARDVGGRLASLTIWGLPAGGGRYAALAALTNIVATCFAIGLYELFLTDSSRVITPCHADFLAGHSAHEEHSQKVILPTSGMSPDLAGSEKAHIETMSLRS